ncbi:hypothetical protein LINPERHAP1_LOCUS7824, partial [Linum perenne]
YHRRRFTFSLPLRFFLNRHPHRCRYPPLLFRSSSAGVSSPPATTRAAPHRKLSHRNQHRVAEGRKTRKGPVLEKILLSLLIVDSWLSSFERITRLKILFFGSIR